MVDREGFRGTRSPAGGKASPLSFDLDLVSRTYGPEGMGAPMEDGDYIPVRGFRSGEGKFLQLDSVMRVG